MNRRATAANVDGLAAIFEVIGDMIDTANATGTVDYRKLFTEFQDLVSNLQALAAPINPELAKACAAFGDANLNAATRDWAGFFAAIAAFAEKLLPLLLPLFTKPATT